MIETTQSVTPLRAITFFVRLMRYRFECRVNVIVSGKRIRITVLEGNEDRFVGKMLEES